MFKLGGKVSHVIRHVRQLFKVKRSKVKVMWRMSRQKCCNSAVDGNINYFKLGGNYRRGGRRVWYTFQVLDFQKFEILTVGPLYWLLYILDMRFVLFLCTTAVWQFAINEYEWTNMNEWMNECASSCQISSKSVKRLQWHDNLTVFKMAAVHHLGFVKFKFFKGQRGFQSDFAPAYQIS